MNRQNRSRCVRASTSGLTTSTVRRNRSLLAAAVLASAAATTIGVVGPVRAAELSWSADGQNPGSGGAGLWNTTDLRWWDGSNFVAWNNAGNDTAVFGGAEGSIYANAPVTFGGLRFTSDMLMGALTGGTFTWGGTTLNLDVANGVSAMSIPTLVGVAGQTLNKTGGGTFRFVGNLASNAGTVNLTAGTLAFASAASDLSNPTHLEISPGATFDMGFVNDAFGSIGGAGTIRLGTFQGLGIVTGPLLNVGTNNLSTTYAGDIVGGGGRFAKSGTGNLTLSGNNTFAGLTQLLGGTLTLAGGSALSDDTFVGMTAAANLMLALQANEVIGSLGSNAGVAGPPSTIPTVDLGSFDLGVGGDNFPSAQFNGIIQGSGRLIKVGSGIQQMATGTNLSTYTGGTVVRGGILIASADRKLGAVPVAPTLNVTLDGGVLSSFASAGYTLDGNRSIEVTSNNGGIMVPQDGTAVRTLSYGGAISGAGRLTKSGPGTLALVPQVGVAHVSSTYTGGTEVIEGTLTSALATTGTAGTPLGSGDVFTSFSNLQFLPAAGAGDVLLAVATDPGRTFIYGPGSHLTLGRNTNTSVQLTVGPTGAAGSSLARGPAGTLVLTPTNGIAELGLPAGGIRLLVNGGVPNANGGVPATNGEMVSGSIVSTTSNADFTGEFLRYDPANGFMKATYSTQTDLNLATANDVFDATANQTVAGAANAYAINVRSGVTVDGAGALTVGSGSGAAGVVMNGGTVSVSALNFGGAQGVLYAGGAGTTSVESRINSNLTGTAGISKVGPGTLTLGGTSLGYTGATHVSQGALKLTASNQLPASTTVTVGHTGLLDLAGTSQSVAGISGRSAHTSGIALGAGGRLTVGSGDSTFLGVISGSGTSTLEKNGTGALTLGYPTSSAGLLSSTNTYNKLVVKGGGAVNVSRDQSLGAVPAANADPTLPGVTDQITLDGGTLRWTGLATATTTSGNSNALSNQRGIVVGPNGATIDVVHPLEILLYQRGNDELAASVRNLISSADTSNPGTVTKTGEGFFRLGVGNQFAGKWVVQQGNLQFQTDSSLGVLASFLPDALTLDGGMIQSNGTGSLSANRGVTVTANGGQIQGFTFNAPVTGPGQIQKIGANTSTFVAASPTWTGGVRFSQGTMVFNATDSAGTGTIVFDDMNFAKVLAKTAATDVRLENAMQLNGGIPDVRVTSGTLILAGAISGARDLGKGLTATSAGTLVLSGTSNFTGKLIINDGAVVVTSPTGLGSAAGATIVNPGASLVFEHVHEYQNPEPMWIAGTGVGGAGALIGQGGQSEVNGPVVAYQDATIAVEGGLDEGLFVGPVRGASAVTKIGAGPLAAQHYRVNTLNVNEGTARVTQRPTAGDVAGTSRVKQLSVAGGPTPTATLDVTNNAFVVDYDAVSPMPTIQAQIINAYNGGAWNQPGITSSLANADQFAVGYAEASDLPAVPAAFGTVDTTSVLFRYTRYGDADLSGTVNLQDFNRLAANFGAAGASWDEGDFDYNGLVNLQDFNKLAANFGLSAAGASVTPADWSALASAVPEPTGLGALALGAAALLGRRRRDRGA